MNFLPDAALFLAVTLALVIAGWCLLPPSRSSLEAAFVPAAAILGGYAWLIWVVGSLWRLIPAFWIALPWPLLLVLIALKRKNFAVHARRTGVVLRELGGVEKALLGYLFALFLLTFVFCLVPPTGTDYDSLTYHLAVPAQYLRAGKIVELPYDHHSYFPLTVEMLYLVGLAARGAVFAKLFHWLMLPLGALALLALGKRAHSARAGLLAACLYASMPMVLQEATTAYIDLGFAAFAFLAVLCFVGAPSEDKGQNWLWSGAFCGFCLGSKYFGWLIFGFLGLWFLVESFKSRSFSVRRLACFAVPALIFGAPWYIRNVFWTGNPVFPFAYGLFGGRGWSAQMAADYDASQAIYGFGKSLSDIILLPWRVAMTPLNVGVFGNQPKGLPFWPLEYSPVQSPMEGLFEVRGLFVNIFPGPALFALGLPALFARNKPRPIALCAGFFAFLWLFWLVTSQQIRYLMPALGLLALVGGWGAAQNGPRFRFAGLVGGIGLTLWLLFSPALLTWRARDTFPVLTGAESGEAYLRRTFGSNYDAMNWANTNTPRGAKFAVYGEPRCFYLNRPYFWADDAHNNLIDYSKVGSGAALATALKSLGASYVLWNADAAGNGGAFGPPQPLMDEAIAGGQLRLLYDERGYRIYSLAP